MSRIGDMVRGAIAGAATGGAGGGGDGGAEAEDWLFKSDDDVSPEQMNEGLVKAGLAEPTTEQPRALFHDPYAVMDWGGWRQRPSALTYDTLRQMTASNTLIAAIIQIRVDQMAQFCVPQQGEYDKGFRVIRRDRRDKNKGMTPDEKKRATELERMIETTGYLLPEERHYDRDSFRSFIKKGVRDILTYDQFCFEKLRDRKGRPSRFQCLPSETIRPAVADVEHMDPAELRNRVAYVQVYEETVIAEFGPDDLAWCIKNPRSDLRVNGFGYSPCEQLIRTITAWLYAFEYNTKFFTQGSAIKGIVNIKGAIPDKQLRAFRRMWYSMVSGVQNAWKTPILNSEDVQWHSFHSTNREMEFGNWVDFLTKLTCGVFGIDPVEVNFVLGGGSSGGSSMFESRPNQAEVTESKDKGLNPLAQHVADCMNQHIVWELDPDFELAFTGLDAKAEAKEREARNVEVRGWKTVNAILKEQELPEMGKLGDCILDPSWLQWASQIQQEEQENDANGPGLPGDVSEDREEEGPMPPQFGGGQPQQPGGQDNGDEGNEQPQKTEAFAASMAIIRTVEELRKSLPEVRRFLEVRRDDDGDTQVIEIGD